MNLNIGIVIVSYHNEAMTERYITQELPKLATPYTVVVVNNDASEQESRKLADKCGLCFVTEGFIPKDISLCKGYVISSKDNLGYAKGNNKGVRFLNKLGKFTHYLFSNDDIEIKHSLVLDVLIDKMKHDKTMGAIGPRVVGLDGRDQSPHDTYVSPYRLIGWRLFPFLRKKHVPHEPDNVEKPISRFTYWVQGSFMLVDACVFNEIGMFDEHTFLYYEEPILAERLAKVGKAMYFDSDVEVVHYEGGSTKQNRKRENIEMESRIYYLREYKHINRIVLFLLKHLL